MENDDPHLKWLKRLVISVIVFCAAASIVLLFQLIFWGIGKVFDIEVPEKYQPLGFYDIQVAYWQKDILPPRTMLAVITAYNADHRQTDSTPFITASGQRVRVGTAANNCLEFGTFVRIDGQIYEITDRMNSRYGCNYFDLYMRGREEAIAYGRQVKEIEIFDYYELDKKGRAEQTLKQ